MKTVSINHQIYNLTDFAKQFDLSYITVRRYYQKGFRNRMLLDVCRKSSISGFVINGKFFRSKNEAAKKLEIKKSTFYRAARNGTLSKVIEKHKNKESSTLVFDMAE
jgi:hypothetical protein